MQDIILELKEKQILKTGTFVLKSGQQSNLYLNLRELSFHPRLFKRIATQMAMSLSTSTHAIIGVPWGALPLASLISQCANRPMWLLRKEEKAYGDSSLLLKPSEISSATTNVTVIEDVITTGASTLKAITDLRAEGIYVEEVLAVCIRNRDVKARFAEENISLKYLFTLDDISQNSVKEIPSHKLKLHDVTKSPLIFSADVEDSAQLLHIIESLAEVVKIFKIHADVVHDFNDLTIAKLNQLKRRYQLYLIEDRKFADIGSIMVRQLEQSRYKYTKWADAIICHGIAGRESVEALDRACGYHEIELLVLGEMSSSHNLIDKAYTKKIIEMLPALESCAGVVMQQRPVGLSRQYQICTPGVKIEQGQDQAGQRYRTPEDVIRQGTDFCIVGRGIRQADRPYETACVYMRQIQEAKRQFR